MFRPDVTPKEIVVLKIVSWIQKNGKDYKTLTNKDIKAALRSKC